MNLGLQECLIIFDHIKNKLVLSILIKRTNQIVSELRTQKNENYEEIKHVKISK